MVSPAAWDDDVVAVAGPLLVGVSTSVLVPGPAGDSVAVVGPDTRPPAASTSLKACSIVL